MNKPTMTITGNLARDPELRFTPSGKPVCALTVASTPRRQDQSGQWVDGVTTWQDVTVWKGAENVAESLHRGDPVFVSGALETEQWQDKQTGEKRSRTKLLADAIGPDLLRAQAKVIRAQRQGQQQASQDDPWSSSPAGGFGGAQEEPPF